MFTVSELAGEARSLHSVFSVWKEKQFSATPVARLWALKHSVRWTTEGQGELKCRPLRNLSSTTSFFLFLLLLYTFLKCCFNWHKEKKLALWGPAPLSCQWSKFVSLLFLVRHSSSAFDPWALPSFLFLSASLCFFKLPLSASPSAQHQPIPHWLPVLFLPSSFLLVYLFTSPCCLPPLLTRLHCAALSSALTSHCLYVCFVEWRSQPNNTDSLWKREWEILHKWKSYFYMLSNLHFPQYLWGMFLNH